MLLLHDNNAFCERVRCTQVNTTKTEVWVAARVATLEVTGKEIREGLLRGIGLFHDDPVRCVDRSGLCG